MAMEFDLGRSAVAGSVIEAAIKASVCGG